MGKKFRKLRQEVNGGTQELSGKNNWKLVAFERSAVELKEGWAVQVSFENGTVPDSALMDVEYLLIYLTEQDISSNLESVVRGSSFFTRAAKENAAEGKRPVMVAHVSKEWRLAVTVDKDMLIYYVYKSDHHKRQKELKQLQRPFLSVRGTKALAEATKRAKMVVAN